MRGRRAGRLSSLLRINGEGDHEVVEGASLRFERAGEEWWKAASPPPSRTLRARATSP